MRFLMWHTDIDPPSPEADVDPHADVDPLEMSILTPTSILLLQRPTSITPKLILLQRPTSILLKPTLILLQRPSIRRSFSRGRCRSFSRGRRRSFSRGRRRSLSGEINLRQLLNNDVERVSEALRIGKELALVLLHKYEWNFECMLAEDAEKLNFLILDFRKHSINTRGKCIICEKNGVFKSCACNHKFCDTCWRTNITYHVEDNPGKLLECLVGKCRMILSKEMMESLVEKEIIDKYSHHLHQNFIWSDRKIKWCPAPDCTFAIRFLGSGENFDVTCLCSHSFCWHCTESPHFPEDCQTVASENRKWILAHTKACPRCNSYIQLEEEDCLDVECRCGMEFCWLCLGKWSFLVTKNAFPRTFGVSRIRKSSMTNCDSTILYRIFQFMPYHFLLWSITILLH